MNRDDLDELEAIAAEHGYKLGFVSADTIDPKLDEDLLVPVFLHVKRGGLREENDDGRFISLRVAEATDAPGRFQLAVVMAYANLVALAANPDDEQWEDE